MEILRRYYTGCVERAKGQADECVVRKLELVMQQAGVTPDICPAVAASLEKAEATGKPAGAMVLPDGSVVTGRTSPLLGASAALLLNALKAVGGIGDQFELISAQVLEPVCRLKTQYLGHKNPRLHTDEVLIALSISAATNPTAEQAMEQLMSRYPIGLLLVTLGAEGVVVHDRQQLHHLPARRIQPLDTTGAGDAFVAGLLAGLAQHAQIPAGDALRTIISQAQGCGALATTAKGAMTALPNREQLHHFLHSASGPATEPL